MALVRLNTLWGSFTVEADQAGRLYCPICGVFTVYSGKDMVYHIAYHVSTGDTTSKRYQVKTRKSVKWW